MGLLHVTLSEGQWLAVDLIWTLIISAFALSIWMSR